MRMTDNRLFRFTKNKTDSKITKCLKRKKNSTRFVLKINIYDNIISSKYGKKREKRVRENEKYMRRGRLLNLIRYIISRR